MTTRIALSHLRAYSQGEMTRREIAAVMDEPVGFGELLVQLSENDLPLPRVPSDPEKVAFVMHLLRQAEPKT